jgi:hypothetical protein
MTKLVFRGIVDMNYLPLISPINNSIYVIESTNFFDTHNRFSQYMIIVFTNEPGQISYVYDNVNNYDISTACSKFISKKPVERDYTSNIDTFLPKTSTDNNVLLIRNIVDELLKGISFPQIVKDSDNVLSRRNLFNIHLRKKKQKHYY